MMITLLELGLLGVSVVVLWYAAGCYLESRDEAYALRASGENGVLKLIVTNALRRDRALLVLAFLAACWSSVLLAIKEDLGLVAVSAKVFVLIILVGACWVVTKDMATRRQVLDVLRHREAHHARKT